MLADATAAMLAPTDASPLLPDDADQRRYDRARRCIYGFDLSDGLSWGIYQSVYSYYLVDVRGESERHASIKSSTGWAVGALGSSIASPLLATLSDLVGRRPLFLFSCTAQVVQLTLLGLLPGSIATWDLNMFVLGFLDASSALGKVVIVDCVDAGYEIGGPRDDCFTRLVYGILEGDGPSTSEQRYAVAFYYKWVITGLGQLAGSGAVGYVLLELLPAKKAMLACGLCRLPMYAALWCCLPETAPAPRSREARLACERALRVAASLLARQIQTLPILCRSRRSRRLLVAFFCLHTAQAGVFSMSIYWGRREFGWGYAETSVWLVATQVAAGLGSVALMRGSLPSLGFRGVALHVALAALGSLAVAAPESRAVARSRAYGDASVVALGALVAQSFGVIPVVFGALTDRPGRDTSKGQLQGALHATVTLASVVATTLYLYVYNTTRAPMVHHPNAIWYPTALLLAVAAACLFSAGDAPKDEVDLERQEIPRPLTDVDKYAAFNDHWNDDP